jgi:hypothetical protein
MTEKMKTIGAGRFLVDVPVEANTRLSREMIGGFEIQIVGETEEDVKKRVSSRRADIEARGSATDGTGGMIAAHGFSSGNIAGQTFVFGLDRGYVMDHGRRIDNGAVPVTPDIVANQQRVADLFYQQEVIPKPVDMRSCVWTWQRR